MDSEDLRHRLLAILAADAVGYSRLMSIDDRSTVRTIESARAVFRAHTATAGGRVVDTAGDSVLAVFETAAGAARAAISVQQELSASTVDTAEDRRMRFRIGLHLGDVIERADGTVYGDGVNIAARLQALADSGGISVSDSIRNAVKGKVRAVFEDQGEQQVKNIADPVRVYRLRADSGDVPLTSLAVKSTSLGGIDLSLPDKPSVAVLAFANLSGDPDQEFFTDGITEDIITELSRFESLFVIARNSSFTYKGKAVNVKQVGIELGVRYVVEGSIRRIGDRIRVTAQLIDTLSGHHVWAERYDRDVQDIFAVQEEVTGCIVAAIAPQVEVAEILRTRRRPGNLTAYELTVRAWGLSVTGYQRSDLALNDESMRVVDAALAIEPENQMALTVVAYDRWMRVSQRRVDNREAAWLDGMDVVNRAIGTAPTAWGHAAKALLLAAAPAGARWRDALTEAQAAYQLNPRDCLVIGVRGMIEANAGDVDKGIELLESAIRMSPRDPQAFNIYTDLAYACLFKGEYKKGTEWVARAISAAPGFVLAHLCATVLHVGLGDIAKASAALREARRISPELVQARLRQKAANREGNSRQRYDVFLRIAAGLEDPSAADAWR